MYSRQPTYTIIVGTDDDDNAKGEECKILRFSFCAFVLPLGVV